MANFDQKLTRIGVFYDGNYFFHVSNYYNYEHPRRARLSMSGLHEFIKNKVAELENTDADLCKVVDAHYFRGRLSAYESDERNKLLSERIFEDILMNEGVVTHYLPLRSRDGRREEKGIDVWLALEAFELAIYKQFNVVVLVASDSDYIPLVRKLNTLGTRVMILGWDFEYTDERTGRLKRTTTSIDLLREASYPVQMQLIIDDKVQRNTSTVASLFVQKDKEEMSLVGATLMNPIAIVPSPSNGNGNGNGNGNVRKSASLEYAGVQEPITGITNYVDDDIRSSTILSLKNGYGFIRYPDNNLFFHWTRVIDGDFSELRENDAVEFRVALGDKGENVAVDVKRVVEDSYEDEA